MKIVAAILKTRRIWVFVAPSSPLHSPSVQIEQQNRPPPTEHHPPPTVGKARKTIGSRLSSCHAAVTFTVTEFQDKPDDPLFHIHFCTHFVLYVGQNKCCPKPIFTRNWEKPIQSILSETLSACAFQDHWQRVRNRFVFFLFFWRGP